MFRSLHIAATGMAAQETHLETISNNIANGNTVGYKRQRVDFQDLLYQQVRAAGAPTGPNTTSPTGLSLGTGVRVVSTSRTFAQGSIKVTDNPLDVAIEGEGFFVVQQADGTPAYTRAGELKTDSEGRIVTPEGFPLEPPINVPDGALSVSIAANGTVSVQLAGETNPSDVGRSRSRPSSTPPASARSGTTCSFRLERAERRRWENPARMAAARCSRARSNSRTSTSSRR
jgi:flagellar basal-body rod protein FlgG